VRTAEAVDELIKTLEGDEKIGASIIRRAIEEPLRTIVSNAGEEGSVVIGKIRESKDTNFGYNAVPACTRTWLRPRHRPDEGHADCIAECSEHLRPVADDRGCDRRHSGEEGSSGWRTWTCAVWTACTKDRFRALAGCGRSPGRCSGLLVYGELAVSWR